MQRRIPLISFLAIVFFSFFISFYNKAAEPAGRSSTQLSKNFDNKKYRVCIGISLGKICLGIEITVEVEGEDYVCNLAEGYCTVTVDPADIHVDENGLFVYEEDVIEFTQGEFQEL